MKKIIQKFRAFKNKKSTLKNERGQGAIEYILLLVVIVAIATLFKDQIKTAVEAKLGTLKESISVF